MGHNIRHRQILAGVELRKHVAVAGDVLPLLGHLENGVDLGGDHRSDRSSVSIA
ncbi:MAG: hypothetical protein ACREDZ_14095 [Kiloniellales bacterium]